ncbi:MAG: hypothetical protein AB2L14_11725 [Candidatus Xenobiia bacterium LiM19]
MKWSYKVKKDEQFLLVRQNEKGEVTAVGGEDWISEKNDDIEEYTSNADKYETVEYFEEN